MLRTRWIPFRVAWRATLPVGLIVTSVLLASPALAVCGNGVVEPPEDCDDGSQNGSTNSCCTVTCGFSG